jgi:hypothetical protein
MNMSLAAGTTSAARALMALALLFAVPVQAQDTAASSPSGTAAKWEYRLTPYLWFSGFNGTLGAGGHTADVDVGFSDVINHLDLALMLTFEARRGPLILLLDTFYADLSGDADTRGPLFSGADFTSKTFMLDFEAGERVAQNRRGSVDALVGLRYWNPKNDLDLHAGTAPAVEVRGSHSWVDPILGAVVRANLSQLWGATLKADIGGFGIASDFTWQIFLGFNYALSKHGAIVFGYRYLDVDYHNDGFVYDVATDGPLLGYQFKF